MRSFRETATERSRPHADVKALMAGCLSDPAALDRLVAVVTEGLRR
ncbi:hypothetical protein [Herbidospora galbida]|nr:hypothetical protein [Herbidospora galbida]